MRNRKMAIEFDSEKTTWTTISELTDLASKSRREEAILRHLVGAALQLRFPNAATGYELSALEAHTNQPGDFHVGDTAFYVTITPLSPVYAMCEQSMQQGFRVYVLVPERMLVPARYHAETLIHGPIHIESIESFVSQILERLSNFSKNELIDNFKNLLKIYNRRIDAAESDKLIMITIPRTLRHEAYLVHAA